MNIVFLVIFVGDPGRDKSYGSTTGVKWKEKYLDVKKN